jgi:hypothetical protein
MITIDQLTSIIAQSEQADVEFKPYRRKTTIYGLSTEGIAVGEGPR